MNERRDQDDPSQEKRDDNSKSRPTINKKHRLFVTLLNTNDRGKKGLKPCEGGEIELSRDFKDCTRNVELKPEVKELKLENLPANGSQRTLDPNYHLKTNLKNCSERRPKFEAHYNPRQGNHRNRGTNSKFYKNSSITRSDESINNLDESRKSIDRNCDVYRESWSTQKYQKNGTGVANRPFYKSREISWSDESLNQNFTPKKEFELKNDNRLRNTNPVKSLFDRKTKFQTERKNVPLGTSKPFYSNREFNNGKAKNYYSAPVHPELNTHENSFDKKTKFQFDRKNAPSGTSKPLYSNREFNNGKAKNYYSALVNPGRYSDSSKEYSRSASYPKDSIQEPNVKGNPPVEDIHTKTLISDSVNRKEKSVNAGKNVSREAPSYGFNGTKDKSKLQNGEENLHQTNKPNDFPFDGCRSDGGSSVSDEPDDSSYFPQKQLLKKEKNCLKKSEFPVDLDCPIPPPHDVDTFLNICKDDDTDSISSENLEPMENYDLPASEEKSHKREESESLDEIIEPELIKSVANYLEKLEKDESKNLADPHKVVKEVNGIFKYYCKGNQVSLYGSYLSELAVGLSNINLLLKSDQQEKNSVLLMLQKQLSKSLKGYDVDVFQEENSLRQSKICFYTPSSVQCVIMYDIRPVSDYYKTDLLLKQIHLFDPRVKTLIMAARKWVEVCCMDENGNNVLHPVGLALLVIYFLQHNKPAILPIIDTSAEDLGLKPLPEQKDLGVGELWCMFLKFYSEIFDWETKVVTIQHKEVLFKIDINWESASVAIQEPYSRKNITESFNSSEYIHSCFKAYYEHLLMDISSSDSETDDNGSDSSKAGKYSFHDSRIKCPLPVFCEDCAELEDEFCEKCQKDTKSVASKVLEKLPELTDHSMKCIDKSLLQVYNTVSLTEGNMKGRQAFVEELEDYIAKLFPDARLKLFGSSVNMFGLKKSDLDICLTLKNRNKDNIDAKHILKRIVLHLRKRPRDYSGVFGLYNAKVPIVKFYFEKGQFLCDLSLYNVLSVHNSRLLSKYAMIDERCRIIGCALKYLTMKGWIADSSSKFLSSYSYILMVIHYLQQTTPPVLPVLQLEDKEVFVNSIDIPESIVTNKNYWYYETAEDLKKRYNLSPRNESSTAELWLGFFEYYLKFDRSFAVTITQKEPLPASELVRIARLFSIEDPFELKRNLGGVLSEENSNKTQEVFLKARSLFGRNVPLETHENVQNHYFSTNNLLGKEGKEMECNFCGAFDHESEDCLKKDPFKKSTIRNSHPATRPGRRKN